MSTETYTIRPVAPTLTPYGGPSDPFNPGQTVTLSTTTTGASIRYTTDGSTPSDTAGTLYTAPITLNSTTTIKAVAYASGLANSTVTTETYTIRPVAPTLTPYGGPSNPFNPGQTVTLSTTTTGASIRYTTDGSTPSDTAGTPYTAPITLNSTTTISAVAYASGLANSTVSTETYTIRPLAPTFTPYGETYTSAQTVTLSTPTTGASVRYTTDGSTPSDTAGTPYTGPITVNSTTTIKAVAYASGLANSTITTETYTILAAAGPVFSPSSGTYSATQTVTLGTSTSGASIRYTTDGSAPSEAAGTLYGGPLTVSANTTVNAIAYKSGLADSPVTSAAYVITLPVAAPTFNPAPGTYSSSQAVALACATAGASIRYTTDGSTPTETVGTRYTAPLTVSATATIKAIAYETAMTDSAVTTATYTISPPTVAGVSPTTGSAGVQVTVSGSGFGATQGTGAVWLGSAPGVVVSWSDTQIVAAVASNAMSGTARVRQGGAWSNAVPFNVNTATILTVTPASGVPGTQVTIAGSSFGAAQGSGQVWLGTAIAVVQTWSDTQIVAQVASGSASGNALVLQNGVMSNPVPFAVNTLQLTTVSPNSGAAGTSVTSPGRLRVLPGKRVAWLGSTAGQVVIWSDTQVVATVASAAVTGIARIQQSGAWSNALGFRSAPAANGMTLMPSLLNMVVGDTHTIQALSAAGQSVTGLIWTSSDPAVVSLSADDPPILTALAAGHVTITAGTASADVTVSAGELPWRSACPWSNPGHWSRR